MTTILTCRKCIQYNKLDNIFNNYNVLNNKTVHKLKIDKYFKLNNWVTLNNNGLIISNDNEHAKIESDLNKQGL